MPFLLSPMKEFEMSEYRIEITRGWELGRGAEGGEITPSTTGQDGENEFEFWCLQHGGMTTVYNKILLLKK